MGFLFLLSCKKENSCEGCNKPPIALAGPDQVITLPSDSISLDGSASNDPDGVISTYLWKRISGPMPVIILNSSSSKTIVKSLAVGSYQFELRVTDDKGLSATHIYDLDSDNWSIGLLPQYLSSYASVISVNNIIYVAGGISCSGNSGCQ